MYSPTTMDHFLNPRNAGELVGSRRGDAINLDCNDTVVMTVRVEGDRVIAAQFLSKGCAGAIASCSAATEMVIGKRVSFAAELSGEAVDEYLHHMPAEKQNCARMAAEAIRKAVAAGA